MHFLTDQLVFPKSTTIFAYSIIELKKKVYLFIFIYYLFMSSTPSFVLYDAYNNEVDDLPQLLYFISAVIRMKNITINYLQLKFH